METFAEPAMHVLTNPALHCDVTSFLTEWPQLIHAFQRDTFPRYPPLGKYGCTTKNFAALNGHLEVLHFLHEQRTERFFNRALESAVDNGGLEMVMYLHKHGSLKHFSTWKEFFMTLGSFDFNSDVSWTAQFSEARSTSSSFFTSHLDVVKFCYENRTEGAPQPPWTAHKLLNIVQFAHEHRTEGYTTIAMNGASRSISRDLTLLRHLHENRMEGCTVEVLYSAVAADNTVIVVFLLANRPEIPSPLREMVRESGGFHVVGYLCRNARHEIADGLLNKFATENARMSMDTLCRQSTKGCLFGVRVVAQARSHYIVEDITQCLRAAHATGATKMPTSNGVGLINRT